MNALTGASWPAPAKLNLMLRVVGRRADGYHLLQTVFQFLDVGDTLRYSVRADGAIAMQAPLEGVSDEDNLCVRAARLLQAASGTSLGADINLDKRLPMGGGLGGGSSDAATTLVALDRLWGTGLREACLADLGAQLGADVSVFVRGRAAWGEGVGEILTPVDLPRPWYLVLCPAVSVSTAEIFKAPELTRNSERITIRDFVAGDRVNDCRPLVEERYPEVREALELVSRGAPGQLTGTGACVFAAYDDAAGARKALLDLPDRFRTFAFVARGLNRSPLMDWVSRDRWSGGPTQRGERPDRTSGPG
ncbi:MAG: 4-(cytidine 5'-diphospho)-2-C-methyl-D-erythritol kinase [Pseudomonadota bacterium]